MTNPPLWPRSGPKARRRVRGSGTPCVSSRRVGSLQAVQALAVFGGKNTGQTHFSDLHVFDLLSETWSQVRLASNTIPAHRACHSVCFV